jgi:diguanylate cyclase (GGDEF)-like protein/PAS domain S-box-containing protein
MTGGQASLGELAAVVLVVTAVRGALLAERSRAAAAVAQAHEHAQVLAGVLEGTTEQAVIGTTPDLRVSMFSRGAERMLGWTAEEVLGRSPLDLWFPGAERDAEDWAEVHRTAEAGESGVFSRRAVCKDGRTLDVVLSFAAQVSETGVLEGHVSVLTDVTAVHAAEAALVASEALFRQAFETAPTGLVLISLAPGEEGRVLQVNQSFATFTGRTEAELLQLRVRDLLDPRDVDAHLTYLVRAAGGGEPEPLGVERRFTTPSGEVRHARKSTSVFRPHGERPFLLAVIEDTTAQRAAEDALVHLAMHDPLTDLPNRALLGDRLERALTADVRQRVGVTVIYIDLDGFKPVNDSHGHAAGDLLLKTVAERLSGAVRAGDTVARLGGDEFAVLCPGLGSEQVPVVLGRMARATAPPVRLPGGAVVRIGLSTGTATAVGGGDPASLLDEADQAMFADKRRRRSERAAAREDAERLAARIDERMAERAAERTARRAAGGAGPAAPAPATPADDGPPARAVADSSR